MNFDAALHQTAVLSNPKSLDQFRQHIPPEFIEEALTATGTATLRRRRLPAEVAIWIVLAIAMFRNRSIVDVVTKLDLALPSSNDSLVAPSAIVQARQRLGHAPLEWLFKRCSDVWAHASAARDAWRGLAMYAVDGSSLRVPDSGENRAHFGGHPSRDGTASGYPLARVVALMAVRSHLLVDVTFGPYTTPELDYAQPLWKALPSNSLTIVDKGFFGAAVLLGIEAAGQNCHWLTPAKSNTKWTVIEELNEDDLIVEMAVSPEARMKRPNLPKAWRARAIRYQRKGFKPRWLLTSLQDAKTYPAKEIVELYHERWEIELGFDEVKTEMLDREEAIRSKTPEAVEQELWGIFLAYNLLRLEIERIAAETGVEPTRISFVNAMRLITDEWLWCAVASPGAIPKHLAHLRANVEKLLVLPPRRSKRMYPRAVKQRTSHYPKKKPVSRGPAR